VWYEATTEASVKFIINKGRMQGLGRQSVPRGALAAWTACPGVLMDLIHAGLREAARVLNPTQPPGRLASEMRAAQ
jgi:hypothetical protein